MLIRSSFFGSLIGLFPAQVSPAMPGVMVVKVLLSPLHLLALGIFFLLIEAHQASPSETQPSVKESFKEKTSIPFPLGRGELKLVKN